jgi:hypothetical protein
MLILQRMFSTTITRIAPTVQLVSKEIKFTIYHTTAQLLHQAVIQALFMVCTTIIIMETPTIILPSKEIPLRILFVHLPTISPIPTTTITRT